MSLHVLISVKCLFTSFTWMLFSFTMFDFNVLLDIQFTDEPITMLTLHLVVCFDHRITEIEQKMSTNQLTYTDVLESKPKCENCRISLPFRFHKKSNLAILRAQKVPF